MISTRVLIVVFILCQLHLTLCSVIKNGRSTKVTFPAEFTMNSKSFYEAWLDIQKPSDEDDYQSIEDFPSELFQGDIKLLPEQLDDIFSTYDDNDKTASRTGLRSELYRWEKDRNGTVIVPYLIRGSDYSFDQKNLIRLAMREISEKTCVEFVPRTNQQDFVYIYSGRGCSSYLGRIGQIQLLSLQNNSCVYKRNIQHELIHALGYDHMHNHVDRDKFIIIRLENVDPKFKFAFEKVNPRIFENFGTQYDYFSIMHYDSTTFSGNGRMTIVTRNPFYQDVIGRQLVMSSGDHIRINRMYKCTMTGTPGSKPDRRASVDLVYVGNDVPT